MTQPAPQPISAPDRAAPARYRRAELAAAINNLRTAVARLTEPTDSYLNNTYTKIPGLYHQLNDALNSHVTNSGRGVAKSFPPVWDEANEQKNNIDLMVGVWPTGTAGNTTTGLRALAAKHWTVHQTRQVRRLAGIINAWADDIEKLLDQRHEHVKYLDVACPACGATTVQRRDSAGELVRSPALQLIAEKGCTCQNEECGHYWAPENYLDLIDQLGFDRPAGVLQ